MTRYRQEPKPQAVLVEKKVSFWKHTGKDGCGREWEQRQSEKMPDVCPGCHRKLYLKGKKTTKWSEQKVKKAWELGKLTDEQANEKMRV